MSRSLAWLTPFSKASDVSAFSRNLLIEIECSAARLGVSPSILVNENGRSYWSSLPRIPLTGTSIDAEIVSSFDFCIYNLGNNQENHEAINELALRVPGVIIVHDLAMHHYMAWRLFEKKKRKNVYGELIGHYYGEPGLNILSLSQICSAVADPVYAPWDTQHVTRFPMIEPFVRSAAAVVVHSAFAEELVRPLTTGPLLRLQLPWDQKPSLTDQELEEWQNKTRLATQCTIVSFGYISRGKCLDLIIEAFGNSPVLATSARLVLAGRPGDAQYLDELRGLVASFGLASRVSFELDVSNERLLELKRDADVFVNLRFPNTEGASGSLAEQLNAGKPVLIYRSGCYAEVPADAAVAVDREDGVQGIVTALERIVGDVQLRIATGQAGRRFVRRIGRKEYIEQLWDFLLEHEDLIRARKACASFRRSSEIVPNIKQVGDTWVDAVARAREVMNLADAPLHVIDARIFQQWPTSLLAPFVATALFGQPPHSKLESALRQWASRVSPASLFHAVRRAYVLWLIVRNNDAAAFSDLSVEPVLDPSTWALLGSLGASVFAVACYVYILGRMPYPGETEKCAGDIERSSPTRILASFLESEEFQQRIPPVSEVNRLQAWIVSTSQATRGFPVMPTDRTVVFSADSPDSARYLVAGWHTLELSGVWSESSHSSLCFRAPTAGGHASSTIALSARVAMGTSSKPRTLSIFSNGTLASSAEILTPEWFDLEFELPVPEDDADGFFLELDCGETVNFAKLGESPDTRDLGILLSCVRLSQSQ